MIDPGASVNLLTLKTLRALALDVQYLDKSKVFLQGFNDQGQRTLGSLVLPIQFGELYTEARFHVIEADVSYRALLGRPWIHEYGIIPSTLHQCMKYIQNGEECRIDGDINPFLVHEIDPFAQLDYLR